MTTGRKFGHHAGPNAGVERAENEAGLNIPQLKVRISFQNVLGAFASCEHAQYVFDSDALPSNNRFAAEDLRVNSDAG